MSHASAGSSGCAASGMVSVSKAFGTTRTRDASRRVNEASNASRFPAVLAMTRSQPKSTQRSSAR